jgi:hypothetical protein
MAVTVANIIRQGWLVAPGARGSFEDILEALWQFEFKTTPAVKESKVAEFVALVDPQAAVRPAPKAAALARKSLNVPPTSELTSTGSAPLAAVHSANAVADADRVISPSPPSDSGLRSSWIRDFRSLKKIQVLGKGSFGTVTLFEDPLTQDMIALKAFDRGEDIDNDITQMFVREIENLIHLSHPCVVPIVGYSLATRNSPAQIGT